MRKSPILDRIEASLRNRRGEDRFREIPAWGQAPVIDLSTNSYLSLHENREVIDAARILAHDLHAGNCASRLIETRSPLMEILEAEIAAWKNAECALLFNSGYAANVGILQAMCGRDTEVFSDRLNHASIIDGIMLSGAKLVRYRHCDMADLNSRLDASPAREKLIVTESVFSMDGDRAPLADICALAQQRACMTMVDEAHATGIFGAHSSGFVEECGCEHAVDIRMGTLSKAVAGLGGFFAGSRMIRDHLVNHARSLIYSTALPHSIVAWDLAAVRQIRKHPEAGVRLLAIASQFRDRLRAAGFDTGASTTHIIPCIVKDDAAALSLSRHLGESGIKAPAIRPPTVPKNGARVRFSVYEGLREDQIGLVLRCIKRWG
jgi:8-amino-7-oxononanoate synthase